MPDGAQSSYDDFLNTLNFEGFPDAGELPPAEPTNIEPKEALFAGYINSDEALKHLAVIQKAHANFELLSDLEQTEVRPALMFELIVDNFLGKDTPSVQECFPGASAQELAFFSRMSTEFRSGMSGDNLRGILQTYGFHDIVSLDIKGGIYAPMEGADVKGIKAALSILEDHVLRLVYAKEFPDPDDFKEAMQIYYYHNGPPELMIEIAQPSDVTGVAFVRDFTSLARDMFWIEDADGIPNKAEQLHGFAGFVYAVDFYCKMSDQYLNDPNGDFKPKKPLFTRIWELTR